MKPFGNFFRKNAEVAETPSPVANTGWENMTEEVPYQDKTTRQQNKIIAVLTEGDINIIGVHSVNVPHDTRQDFLDEVASKNIGNNEWQYIISHIGGSENKRQEYRDAIKSLEAEALSPRVSGDLYEADGQQYQLTPELLERFGLAPKDEMNLDSKRISFSQMYKVHGHLACTSYVTSEEGTKICSYYRSNSSGSWRYLPEYTSDSHWFGKGYNEESLTLPFEMQKKLTELSDNPPLNLDDRIAEFAFFGTAKRYANKDSVRQSHRTKKLRGIHYKESSMTPSYALSPDVTVGSRPAPETIGVDLMNSPFCPDYQKEISSYQMHTDLYGDVTVKAYPSENGQFRYSICEVNHNNERQAWISSVESTNKTTAVGTPKQWVSAGVLATPLYEYGNQTGGYGDKTDTKNSYESMWKGYISKIPLIQKYIQETGNKE